MEGKETLAMLRSEFPPLMDQLLDNVAREKRSRFLPADVVELILRIIGVRRPIFVNAEREKLCTTCKKIILK